MGEPLSRGSPNIESIVGSKKSLDRINRITAMNERRAPLAEDRREQNSSFPCL
jgi:hypothetical protein